MEKAEHLKEGPSFSDEVKAELAHIEPARPCCQHAELQAIIEGASPANDGDITIRVTRNSIARRVVSLTRATGGEVTKVIRGTTGRRPSYRVTLRPAPSGASAGSCCARAALRGAFLVRGVVGDPARSYHLEIRVPGERWPAFADLLQRLSLPAQQGRRRAATLWYLKGAPAISRVLGLLGANRAVLRFEHGRIVREMRGQANRRTNSETANLDRNLRAAVEQVARIQRARRHDPMLKALPGAVRQAARLRLDHPQASLRELADAGGVSKPAMAGRLHRLMRLID
jgi:DNA-binding transcriptional regulator WhiA